MMKKRKLSRQMLTVLLVFLMAWGSISSVAGLFAPDVRVSQDFTNSGQRNPSLGADGSGNIYVAWDDSRDGDKNIYFSKSVDGGLTWSDDKRVDDDTNNGTQVNPSLGVDGSGNIYVAWQDSRNGATDIYFSKSTNGGSTWSANTRVDNSAQQLFVPSLTVDGSGNIYVVWYNGNFDKISFSKSTDGGSTWSNDIRLDQPHTDNWKSSTSLSVDGSGNVYVAWDDNRWGNDDIYFAKEVSVKPTLVTLQGKLTDSTTGNTVQTGSIRVTIKDGKGNQIWQNTFDDALNDGVFNIPLGARKSLLLMPDWMYHMQIEIDADSAVYVAPDVTYGDNTPAGDVIKFKA